MSSTLDHLATLVAFETESGSSNLDLVEWCVDRASALGGTAQVLAGAPERANVLIRFGPNAPGGLLLAGHSDVVPAGEGWSSPPYRLTLRKDRVVGRGSADMKGFLASVLGVLEDRVADQLEAPVHLSISFDEEIGCKGVSGLLDHLDDRRLDPQLVIVGEPTMMTVCTAHPGKRAFDVSLSASPGHSSRSLTLPSALVGAAELAVAVDHLQRRDAAASFHVTTNVGRLHGGCGVNVIAPKADVSFELRYPADADPDMLLAPVWETTARLRRRLEAVGGGIDVVESISYPGLLPAARGPAVDLLASLTSTTDLGAIEFGCEAGLYAMRLGAPVVICGPGDIAHAHRPDEFVSVEQLRRCDGVLSALIQTLCGATR